MGNLIEQGSFQMYADVRLDEARSTINEYSLYSKKTTVFISHKHDELQDLKGVLGFLQRQYDVKAYIDSQDPSMPQITTAATAANLKARIKKCDKFILLATNAAIDSEWCNWELGYGDAQKFKAHIALFPLKPKGSYDYLYKGAEYLSLYPYICYEDGTDKYDNGAYIQKGYYVVTPENGKLNYQTLAHWFLSR